MKHDPPWFGETAAEWNAAEAHYVTACQLAERAVMRTDRGVTVYLRVSLTRFCKMAILRAQRKVQYDIEDGALP